jgi:hypothetical protein
VILDIQQLPPSLQGCTITFQYSRKMTIS